MDDVRDEGLDTGTDSGAEEALEGADEGAAEEMGSDDSAQGGSSDLSSGAGESGEGSDEGAAPVGTPVEVETATYRITGLVDIHDEQNNITGQFPIGSEQVLPTFVGDAAEADGRAEKVEPANDTEVE